MLPSLATWCVATKQEVWLHPPMTGNIDCHPLQWRSGFALDQLTSRCWMYTSSWMSSICGKKPGAKLLKVFSHLPCISKWQLECMCLIMNCCPLSRVSPTTRAVENISPHKDGQICWPFRDQSSTLSPLSTKTMFCYQGTRVVSIRITFCLGERNSYECDETSDLVLCRNFGTQI